MNCAEVKEQLEAAFDGRVTPELQKALMLHLRTCASCHNAWDEMQALRSMLQASPVAAPSSSLDERVMEAFNKAHSKPVAPWWQRFVFGSIALPKPAFALALIAFMSLLVLALYVGRLTATPILVTNGLQTAVETAPPPSQRIVYVSVEAEPGARSASPTPPKRAIKAGRTSSPVTTTERPVRQLESFTVVTASGTNYATKATLKGFEPVETASVRIIKGRGE